MKNKVFLIAISPVNSILNDFFEKTITIYPTNEIGNIYYTKNIVDTGNLNVLNEYKKFIEKKVLEIKKMYHNPKFMLFNDKVKITSLCQEILDKEDIICNDYKLVEKINDKFYMKKILENNIPMIKYKIFKDNLKAKLYCKKINKSVVYQIRNGSGGDGTYLITNYKEFDKYNNLEFSISDYIEHIPINITTIIGEENFILFPISVQLIQLYKNKFKYVGADFIYPNKFKKTLKEKIYRYSKIIINKVKNEGYRGILGIDYLIDSNDNIYFSEVNCRFQSSSFLINKELRRSNYDYDLGKLHYMAIVGDKLPNIERFKIKKSFLNSDFSMINEYSKIKHEKILSGFFELKEGSIYRQIYYNSIYNKSIFV